MTQPEPSAEVIEAAKREFLRYFIMGYDVEGMSMDALAFEAARAALNAAEAVVERENGCPCTLVEPCSRHCTCATPILSGGCARCARYGSLEQRMSAARRLAALELPSAWTRASYV